MYKILLVDDEPKVLTALSAALGDDHDIYVSESASGAKSAITNEGFFDVIITDEVMPGIKGHDLLKWCKEHTPKSKLIMLTGLPVTEKLKQSLGTADEVTIFTKPWDLGAIINAFPERANSDKAEVTAPNNLSGTMLVLESSDRYRELYQQFQAIYFDEVVFYDSVKGILDYEDGKDKVSQIVLSIPGLSDSELIVILAVSKAFPDTEILVTAPPAVIKHLRSIANMPSKVSLLVHPFSFKRLVNILKPETVNH